MFHFQGFISAAKSLHPIFRHVLYHERLLIPGVFGRSLFSLFISSLLFLPFFFLFSFHLLTFFPTAETNGSLFVVRR